MKVMHLIDSLGYGGAERLIVDLMPRLQQQGVDPFVVSVTDTIPLASRLENVGIPVMSLNFNDTIYSLPKLTIAAFKLRKLILKHEINIVHSHLYTSDILARVATPSGCKIINTLHNRDPWWYERNRLKSVARTSLDRQTHARRSVRSIAVSNDVYVEAIERLGLHSNSVRMVANGIDFDRFVERRFSRSPKAIIQVGRFYPVKGHDTSLKAFKRLQSEFPELCLKFIGGGPEENSLRLMARELGIENSVHFLGQRDDVPEQLLDADIFWMPSRWEGLPIACIEAMAAGLPVVATGVGGIPELVRDGTTGYLIEPDAPGQLAEATMKLLNVPELVQRFGQTGRSRVYGNFTIDATSKRYMDAYWDLQKGAW